MAHRKAAPISAVSACILTLFAALQVIAGDGLRFGTRERLPETSPENQVRHRCLAPEISDGGLLGLERTNRWSLPKQALAADFDTTIHCLILRYNFQYEDPDNPNTTGRGWMNLAPHPLAEFGDATPEEEAAYLDSVGHFIDPPPHDSLYFDRHMRALATYWNFVSDGKIGLTWDIYPPASDSAYLLPHEMSHYGFCDLAQFDSIVAGLERYVQDGIRLADTAHVLDPGHPNIDFSQYQSFFLFHAGADRQTDLNNPPTCNDLLTGFIRLGDSVVVPVDNGTDTVTSALMMPETQVQDNRATALNAVLTHEFGHQLGLVDLYSTFDFRTILGDFALMDNAGNSVGIDFGFPAGRSFGIIPTYPSAWSKAHLGLVPVVDFRQGEDIRVVAAAVQSSGIKIARVPISETEYYLIENRQDTIYGGIYSDTLGAQFDTLTNVVLGPARRRPDGTIVQTGEYDFLLPGAGMLIYHVDEGVASLDYTGNGRSNFADNTLQWNPRRKFVKLIEGDGIVHLYGESFRAGYGLAEDMYRDDRNTAFTPNTNPPSIDNSGNNTHVYITDITRAADTTLPKRPLMDSVILFDLEIDKLAENFPVRAGTPSTGLSPIADDIDGDGTDEIIVASGRLLSVFTTTGENFLQRVDPCVSCPTFYDTMITSINRNNSFQPVKSYPVPVYVETPEPITAGPVTGDFGTGGSNYVAIGYPLDASGINYNVVIFDASDNNDDGRADGVDAISPRGKPIALSFGDILYVLTRDTVRDSGYVYRKDELLSPPSAVFALPDDEYFGLCRIDSNLVVLAGNEDGSGGLFTSTFYFLSDSTYSFSVDGRFVFGPVAVDVNRDGLPEIAAFSEEGDGILVTIDPRNSVPEFSILAQKATGYQMTANPTVGDVDLDGYPDIIIGGSNALMAFNSELILKTNFPIEVDDRHRGVDVITSAMVADIQDGGLPEVIFSNNAGNVYAYGGDLAYGFPINSGEQNSFFANGSAVVFSDSTGGLLGFLGGDGWFYAWQVDADSTTCFWPMAGGSSAGANTMDTALLGSPVTYAESLPEDQFYNYPNPVLDGQTTIRYFLGEDADRVTLNIFTLTGERVATLDGSTAGGTDNEVIWNCGDITPGVYRCVIEADLGGDQRTAFTDIAIIR